MRYERITANLFSGTHRSLHSRFMDTRLIREVDQSSSQILEGYNLYYRISCKVNRFMPAPSLNKIDLLECPHSIPFLNQGYNASNEALPEGSTAVISMSGEYFSDFFLIAMRSPGAPPLFPKIFHKMPSILHEIHVLEILRSLPVLRP